METFSYICYLVYSKAMHYKHHSD